MKPNRPPPQHTAGKRGSATGGAAPSRPATLPPNRPAPSPPGVVEGKSSSPVAGQPTASQDQDGSSVKLDGSSKSITPTASPGPSSGVRPTSGGGAEAGGAKNSPEAPPTRGEPEPLPQSQNGKASPARMPSGHEDAEAQAKRPAEGLARPSSKEKATASSKDASVLPAQDTVSCADDVLAFGTVGADDSPRRGHEKGGGSSTSGNAVVSEDSMALKATGDAKGLGWSLRRPGGLEKLQVDTHGPMVQISVSNKAPGKSPAGGMEGGGGVCFTSGGTMNAVPITPSSRRSFSGGFAETRKKGTEVSSSKLRSTVSLPLAPDLSSRVQSLLSGMTDSGELLRYMYEEDHARKRILEEANQTRFGGVSRVSTDGKSDEKEAEDSLSRCLQSMLDSEPYRRLSAVKESLARVYVLTTAKHLLSSLVKAKEALQSLTGAEAAEVDMKTFPAMLTRTLEALTGLTARNTARGEPGFLQRSPVPALVARHFREVPMLSQAFVALAQTSLRVLIAADNVVRRVTLENAPRYFYSSAMLKKDLEVVWQHISIGGLFVEYYAHLSREALMSLPYTPLTKLEVFTLISIGIAKHKLMLEKQHATAALTPGVGGVAKNPATKPANLNPTNNSAIAAALNAGHTNEMLSSLASPGGTVQLTTAPPPPAEMDPDTLDVVQKAFLSEEPFRCSPFLVTFAPKNSDPRPKYDAYSRQEAAYPQLLLSLSRQLYIGRCTPESLEDYFHQHYEVVQDYMTCSDMPHIVDSALTESGGPLPVLMRRGGASWTFNLYADMVMADFTTRFYMDFQRKVSSSTDTNVLAFSPRFAELQKPMMMAGIHQLLGISPDPASHPLASTDHGGLSSTSSPVNDLIGTLGGSGHDVLAANAGASSGSGASSSHPTARAAKSLTIQVPPDAGGCNSTQGAEPAATPNYILLVSERLFDSLRVADVLSHRDPICASAMSEAMVVWYVLWARASLNRSVAMVSKATAGGAAGAGKEATVFDSLRKVCALCSDVNSIARFCTAMVSRMRIPLEEGGSKPMSALRSSRSPGGTVAMTPHHGATSALSPATSRIQRKGFILSPANKTYNRTISNTRTPKMANAMAGATFMDGTVSPTTTPSRRPGGGGGGGAFSFEGAAAGGNESGTDMSAYDVIVNDLVAMVGDLRLLSAQCLEHATEIATHMTRRICKEQFGSRHATNSVASLLFGGGQAATAAGGPKGGGRASNAAKPPAPRPTMDVGADGVGEGSSACVAASTWDGDKSEVEARTWAIDLVTLLFRPLAEFCRKDELCSSVLLPRLVEACLHTVLDVIAAKAEPPSNVRVTAAEARALQCDFMYLRDFVAAEQRHQSCKANLSSLPVIDRIHVVLTVLGLPPSLSQWQPKDLAALYLLPDAPRWIRMRTDRGRVANPVFGRLGMHQDAAQQDATASNRPAARLSVTVSGIDTEKFEKVYAEFESQRANKTLGGKMLAMGGSLKDTRAQG